MMSKHGKFQEGTCTSQWAGLDKCVLYDRCLHVRTLHVYCNKCTRLLTSLSIRGISSLALLLTKRIKSVLCRIEYFLSYDSNHTFNMYMYLYNYIGSCFLNLHCWQLLLPTVYVGRCSLACMIPTESAMSNQRSAILIWWQNITKSAM